MASSKDRLVTKYSKKIAETICERIMDGQSVREICRSVDMPNERTVYRWLAKYEDFEKLYVRAKDFQMDQMAEEILDIADDGLNDWMARSEGGKGGGWQANGEHIQRSRVRIDTRKWLMSKLKPKKYGDRLDLGVKGDMKVVISNSDKDL